MKIKKIFLLLLCNLVIFGAALFCCDYYTYKMYVNIYNKVQQLKLEKFKYELITKNQSLKRERKIFKTKLRKPDGLQYKNKSKHSIVLFGCSYAYGVGLAQNQTFSYKLSQILKTPVYNRALAWGNLQEMWYQAAAEGSKDFYTQVPKSDTYIYLMMYDHYNRMYSFFTVYTYRQYLNYIDYNGNLKTQLQSSLSDNILSISYTYRHIKNLITYKYLQNPKNKDEIINRAVKYIVSSKKELENQNGKDIKFIVILYDDIDYDKELVKELNKNNIHTIRTKDITDKKLKNAKYTLTKTDSHPNEKAWNLLTPVIASEIKKIWEEK